MVALLVQAGADRNATNEDGRTAYDILASAYQEEYGLTKKTEYRKVMQLLADPQYKQKGKEAQKAFAGLGVAKDVAGIISGYVHGASPLYKIKSAIKSHENTKLQNILDEDPANIDEVDSEGNTPLLLAIKAKNMAAVELIVDNLQELNKDDVINNLDHTNKQGEDARALAKQNGLKEKIPALFMPSDFRDNIIQGNNNEVMQYVNAHSDVLGSYDDDYKTPLMLAVRYLNYSLVQFFIQKLEARVSLHHLIEEIQQARMYFGGSEGNDESGRSQAIAELLDKYLRAYTAHIVW